MQFLSKVAVSVFNYHQCGISLHGVSVIFQQKRNSIANTLEIRLLRIKLVMWRYWLIILVNSWCRRSVSNFEKVEHIKNKRAAINDEYPRKRWGTQHPVDNEGSWTTWTAIDQCMMKCDSIPVRGIRTWHSEAKLNDHQFADYVFFVFKFSSQN